MKTFQVPIVKNVYGFVEVKAKNETEAMKIIENLIDNEDIDDEIEVTHEEYEILEDGIEEVDED